MAKIPPAKQETPVQFLGQEDPLEKGQATHSSILAWRIPTDRGAWRATVHWIAQSQTGPSDLTLSLFGMCEVNKPTCQDGHRFFAQKKAAAWGTIETVVIHSFILRTVTTMCWTQDWTLGDTAVSKQPRSAGLPRKGDS